MRDLALPATTPFKASGRRLRRAIPASLKGIFRRQAGYLFPSREAREYETWMARHLKVREAFFTEPVEPNLLSVLTPVWDGVPLRYFEALADSIVSQNRDGACEWVIVDNGSSKSSLLSFLERLRAYSWVKLHRLETNTGIIGGLHHCLQNATGRYVLPVDADDLLYPDALRVVASNIRRSGNAALFYTDEDKISGKRRYQPYLKPDWDPVLLLNSAYIAHLGVLDRERALELGAYSDPEAEGSPDWDVFIRFLIAGYSPTHIPEVLYSWRMHAQSTADDAGTKPYVHSSQKAVLRRFLDSRSDAANFNIEYSPLLGGAAHWHFSRARREPKPFATVLLGESSGAVSNGPEADLSIALSAPPQTLLPLAREMAEKNGFVQLVGQDVEREMPQSSWEALGIFDLHRDTVMVGGRIRNRNGIVTEAGYYFGFDGVCGCPHRGRSSQDAGYFTHMWKQRSVSAVAAQFAVVKAEFLVKLLKILPPEASLAFLGAWAGAYALRTGGRVVYSPFLSGVSDLDWETLVSDSEKTLFARLNQDLIPDRRFYSRYLSLDEPFALANAEFVPEI